MFTFKIGLIFGSHCIVVPLYSHATKSTPTTPKTIRPATSDKPNYSLPKLLLKNPHQNKLSLRPLSLTLYLYPTSLKSLINPTQINKISPKTPHPHNTPTSNLTPSTTPTKLYSNSE